MRVAWLSVKDFQMLHIIKVNFSRCLRNANGSTAIMFALALPAMVAVLGVAADFSVYNLKASQLQNAADQAALAAAKEFSISNSSDSNINSAADAFVRASINDSSLNLEVVTETSSSGKSVKVEITERWAPFFAHFFDLKVTPIVAHATAGLFGESKICVLALSPSGPAAVGLTKDAHLQAGDCSVYSNSDSSSSIYLGDVSSLHAKLVCTVGALKDGGGLGADQVVTDCPVLSDPLASRPAPKVGLCDFTKLAFTSGTHVLTPGVYCGGIAVSGTAVVELQKGDYIVKDGLLLVREKATLRGDDVSIFLTGAFGLLHFMDSATIELSGRETGPMAGLLIYDEPKGAAIRLHTISASNAHTLTGTVYMPKGNLMIDPTATVGERSAYTAIVVNRLIVQNGPTLVLNTNYNATPVPVPDGIRAAADVHLIE